jgi:hypothetical protein
MFRQQDDAHIVAAAGAEPSLPGLSLLKGSRDSGSADTIEKRDVRIWHFSDVPHQADDAR